MVTILPSILTADFLNLSNDIEKMIQSGIKMVHIDVMDGNFVPNITFGHKVIADIKKHFNIQCDAHLMVTNPEKNIDKFIKAGADIITVHIEATEKLDEIIDKIKAAGKKVGISINPDTPVDKVKNYIEKVDMFLVMSVFPGYGGQKFIDSSLDKIKALKKWKEERGLDYYIEVDGGIKQDNVEAVINSGANMIVVGSDLYKNDEFTIENGWIRWIAN